MKLWLCHQERLSDKIGLVPNRDMKTYNYSSQINSSTSNTDSYKEQLCNIGYKN